MSIHLAKVLISSSERIGVARQWSLTSHISRRYVQEFTGMRYDNSIPLDYAIILPEKNLKKESGQDELFRIPKVGEPEVDFSKLNPELCYKGLSQAICAFEDFLSDVNNQTVPPYESIQELFKEVEKNLYPLDYAYNIFFILLIHDRQKYNYAEIGKLIDRYVVARRRRKEGQLEKLLQKLVFENKKNFSNSDLRMLEVFQTSGRRRMGVIPMEDNTLAHLRENLAEDIKVFHRNVELANRDFSHIVDDPDILSAISTEFDDLQVLHHKERTPLQINVNTYNRFMRLCPDRFVRKILWQTYNRRASPKGLSKKKNILFMDSIRTARRRIANCMGYRSHLELRLEGTMAGTKQRVLDSLNAIDKENKPRISERLEEVYDYALDHSFSDSSGSGLLEYDIDFWSNRYVNDIMIGMSNPELRMFFPLTNVIQGITHYFQRYFSIGFKIESKLDDPLWSADVKFIQVDRRGKPLGSIIFDPHHKSQNKSNAIYTRLRSRVQGSDHLPARFMSTSFAKNNLTGQANLSVSEVILLFRLFGTAVQGLMYNYPYYELNTYGGLEPDIEQLFPNLCEAHLLSDYKILQSCSVRDGKKPIDSELASRIIKGWTYLKPFKTWFELYKAHLDLDVHSLTVSTKNLVPEVYNRYSPFPRDPDNYDYCSMIDIFVGPQDALLYGNLWSKQLTNCYLTAVRNSSHEKDDQKMVEMLNKLLDVLFEDGDISSEEKLSSLIGQRFEPSELGLGVL